MADITDFGQTAAGAAVHKITLSNHVLRVSILTLGAILQSVRMAGVGHDLTLGSDKVADYQGAMMFNGSLIAPVVNRITDARADISGQTATFEANFMGQHCLHSGAAGVQHKVWALDAAGADFAQLSLDLPDGEGGFPGNRHVTARFALDGASLRLDITVRSDKDTLWNAANHSYWNLDGSPTYDGHSLKIMADHYLPTTDAFIPTGEVRAVSGTDMDFRSLRPIAPGAPVFDNNFCLGDAPGPMRPALILRGASGLTMTVATTEPGIQVYDHRQPNPQGGPAHPGLAIEAQNWPGAPNHPHFPSVLLMAAHSRTQSTSWHFA